MKVRYTKECLGSLLAIDADVKISIDSVIAESFSYIDDFEQTYSRFIKGNWLYQLNEKKKSNIPVEIRELIKLSIKISKMTQGYYDITILPLLENAGYGIHEGILPENIGYQNIELYGDMIHLHNGISLDFGSFGKGYIADYLYKRLNKYLEKGVINFGGDMRIMGEQNIHLEHPENIDTHIGYTPIHNKSIASSAGSRRKLTQGSHLQSHIEMPQGQRVQATYITHPLCVMADILSTALFVSPFSDSCMILENIPDLEGMIISEKGEVYTSTNFIFTPTT